MKILHISKYYYPYIGGVENICKYIVEGDTEHETAVVCFNEDNKDVIDEVNGHKVYRVATWINVARQALSLSYFPMLRKAIKEFKPDLIHFHWANPFPAAVLLAVMPKNVKLVIHWHMDIIKQKRIYPFIKPIETALLKRAESMFTVPKMIEECEISYNKISDMNVMKFCRSGIIEYFSIPLAMSHIQAAHNVEHKMVA